MLNFSQTKVLLKRKTEFRKNNDDFKPMGEYRNTTHLIYVM